VALRAYGEVHVREIRCRHMTGNFLYKIDGNKATGQASVLATLATPGGYKFFAQGRYVDQLVKQRGQWLIVHRRVDLAPLGSDPEKIVGLSDPDVAPLFQPLIDAWGPTRRKSLSRIFGEARFGCEESTKALNGHALAAQREKNLNGQRAAS